jgi:hypothetical protein
MFVMFHLDVVFVCNDFQMFSGVLANVSDFCFKYFIFFFCMLQLLYLDVSK